MSWIKIDDNFADHPKFVGLSNDAVATWVRALGYCNRHMTDGKLGKAAARLCARSPKADRIVAELVEAGLWEQAGDSYQLHDYLDWNESRETRQRRQNEAKDRKERWKEQKRNASGTRSSGVPAASPNHPGTQTERTAEAEAEAYMETLGEGAQGATAPPAAAPTPKVEPANAKPPRAARGTRCPSSVDPEAADWCARHGLPSPAETPELRRMLDHFAAAPGARGVKLDWGATWRNWSGRAAEFARPGVNGTKTRTQLGLQPLVVGEYDGGGYVDT